MPLSNVNVTIQDGGLGILDPNSAVPHGKVGVSSQGVANQVVLITDKSQIAAFGTGPLVNALNDAFDAGSRQIYAVLAEPDINGTKSAITSTKTGQGDVTVSGNPLDAYEVKVEILSDGGFNQATFKYSLDGGDSYSEEITVPTDGAYVIANTGLTLNFTEYATTPADSFKTGDVYNFTTTAPTASIANITNAVNALLDSNYSFDFIHVVGESDSSVWTALDTIAEDAVTEKYRFIHFLCEAAYLSAGQTTAEWVQSLIAARASFDSVRVSVCAAFAEIENINTERIFNRNGAGIYSGRVSSIPSMRSPARVRDGNLPNVKSINPVGLSEEQIAALDAAGYITFRTYEGKAGVYVTDGRMMAPAGSDFQFVEHRRVMDKACRNLRRAALEYKHAEVDPLDQEGSLAHFQASLQQELDAMAAGSEKEISSGRIEIPEQDILATSKLRVKIRIVPIGIMREIELDLGFENPFSAA